VGYLLFKLNIDKKFHTPFKFAANNVYALYVT